LRVLDVPFRVSQGLPRPVSEWLSAIIALEQLIVGVGRWLFRSMPGAVRKPALFPDRPLRVLDLPFRMARDVQLPKGLRHLVNGWYIGMVVLEQLIAVPVWVFPIETGRHWIKGITG
jgi:hypothetical protein